MPLDELRQKEKTVFQNKMIDVVYYLFSSFAISSKPGRLMLPNLVEISEKRFNEILSAVTKAKNKGLRANIDWRETTLDNIESLLKDLGNEILNGSEFKNRYNNIVDDREAILNKPKATRKQKKNMTLLREVIEARFNKEPDTTDVPELESEESAAERRIHPVKGLKILTLDEILSILPISLTQLKAGNNSQKLKNEIRQLFYSLYSSKKLTEQLYKSLVDII